MTGKSAQLIISNLTPEQDCVIWFEEQDIEAPHVDVHKNTNSYRVAVLRSFAGNLRRTT